jgi:hypothetical protein
VDTCARCGAELGVGRFCLNCGHRIGDPLPETTIRTARVPAERHQAAAEQAKLLQGPAPAPAPADRSTADDAWLVHDAEDDDEARGPNWAAWVLAALALLVGVFLALSFVEDRVGTNAEDGDPASAEQSPATSDTSDEPDEQEPSTKPDEPDNTGGARPVDVARGATVTVPATAPPTTDLDGTVVPYNAALMLDGDPRTAWRMAGDGTGASITLTLRQPAEITRVGLINGYAKQVEGVDWYPNNRRILSVRWTFEDGSSVDQELVETPQVQRIPIVPGTSSTVTLTLLTVSPPGVGELGRDYTAISTIEVRGRPAG